MKLLTQSRKAADHVEEGTVAQAMQSPDKTEMKLKAKITLVRQTNIFLFFQLLRINVMFIIFYLSFNT